MGFSMSEGFFMHKSYKFRLYPNKTQEILLNKTMGCVRFAWNQCVQSFNSYHKDYNPKPQFKSSKELRQELEWMNEVSAAAVQQKHRDFLEFKNQYFNKKRKKAVKRPRFKSKRDKQSYRLPNQKIKCGEKRIRLEKIGWVRHDGHRKLPEVSKVLSATISKTKSGKFFVSVTFEYEPVKKTSKNVAGIDVGFTNLCSVWDGKDCWVYDNPNIDLENQDVKKLQRHLARKKKGSNRWNKCRIKLANAYEKLANKRDFELHNISRDIVDNFGNLVLETLDIEQMKGIIKRVNHKIGSTALSRLRWFLEYKTKELGNEVVFVDKYYPSSKICSSCGNQKPMPLTEKVYDCQKCGYSGCRDENASKNLRNKGLEIIS